MSDEIALVLIKRIEALEEQVAELKAPKLTPAHLPIVWPQIDYSALRTPVFVPSGTQEGIKC